MAEETYNVLRKTTKDSNTDLEKQISGIELKQQEIQNYITTIDNAVNQLEQMIHQEQNSAQPNYDRIRGLRTAISKNVELISALYNSYKEFENVKFRYYKEINDNNYKTNRLIELELKKVDNQTDKIGEEFANVMRHLTGIKSSGNDELLNQARAGLEEEEYDL